MLGRAVEVVHPSMLVVQGLGQYHAPDARAREHGLNKRLEFDITVVQISGHGSTELHLIRLEARVG